MVYRMMIDPSARLAAGIKDPILGPKELRPLLIFRGISG